MCNKPLVILLPNKEPTAVSCRKCEQCYAARRRHWVGRLLAEEKTAKAVWFVTLTYGGGYENDDAMLLEYSHVQKMFKRMRKAGHRFKYVVVGEYGDKKGRAHWHLLLYWNSPPPRVTMDQRIQWDFWEEGYTQIEYPRSKQGAAVYIMKYLTKDNIAAKTMRYSKVPMLGADYMLEYAREHARAGLPLFQQSDRFTIPDAKRANGKLFYYPVGRDTAIYDKMITAWLSEWAVHRPTQPLKLSAEVTEWLTDATQNVDDLPADVQIYVKRHYGIEGVADYENTFTQHHFRNFYVQLGTISKLVVVTDEGKETWQKDLKDADRGLTVEQAHALALENLQGAPSRLSKVLPHEVTKLLTLLDKPKPEKAIGASRTTQGWLKPINPEKRFQSINSIEPSLRRKLTGLTKSTVGNTNKTR